MWFLVALNFCIAAPASQSQLYQFYRNRLLVTGTSIFQELRIFKERRNTLFFFLPPIRMVLTLHPWSNETLPKKKWKIRPPEGSET